MDTQTTAVSLSNITKRYTVFYEAPALIKNILPFLKTPGSYENILAIDNFSKIFLKGECCAIIGANGSGKSTLLQIIAGITQPTTGEININGKVSTLLELNSGFHPELTGAENIFLNSSILGINKKDVKEKFNEILAFSELDKFINSKVKIYSSGMFMRLGFAIAIQMNFDIFVCDEFISVGDMYFQNKCYNKLKEFKKQGKCIIFATHNFEVVDLIADCVIWLDKGKIKAIGKPQEIISAYKKHFIQ